MTEHYLCVYPNGELRWIPLERVVRYDDFYDGEEAILLRDLYPVIGCDCVEQVYTTISRIVMMVDECGRIKDPPQALNPLASRFYAGTQFGDPIVGPAVFMLLRRVEPYWEFDCFPLSPADEAAVADILGRPLPPKPLPDPLPSDLKGGDPDD